MYLSSSTKYFAMYLGTSTSTFFKLKYKVQASTRKNVLKYRQVQVPMYLAQTLNQTYNVTGYIIRLVTLCGSTHSFCDILPWDQVSLNVLRVEGNT